MDKETFNVGEPREVITPNEFAKLLKSGAFQDIAADSPFETQVGGRHYMEFAIQPVDFITQNKLNFLEGCIVKRICRHRMKGGAEDLIKIKHEVDLLLALEYGQSVGKT